MSHLAAFSPDYVTARNRFLQATRDRGWRHEAHLIDAPGFARGDLTIDAACIGSDNADRMLILSSGLHGTEAFFGSAVQMAWLNSLPSNWIPPEGMRVLLLHALNPFGFATIRRANEVNVDLNRNFVEPDQFERLREETARTFGPLDPYLNPPRPPGRFSWFPLLFPWMALRLGRGVLQKTLPVGQYAFPKGIFYGGQQHCQTTRIIMSEMPRWIGSAQRVLHLDFHTGLGRFGVGKLLASDPPDSDRVRLAESLFGKKRVEADHQTAGGYHNHGDMGEWLSRRFEDRTYIYLCAEFGTYGSTRVIGALRMENQAHHWADPRSRRFHRIKRQTLESFTPLSPQWRERVVAESLRFTTIALEKWANPA